MFTVCCTYTCTCVVKHTCVYNERFIHCTYVSKTWQLQSLKCSMINPKDSCTKRRYVRGFSRLDEASCYQTTSVARHSVFISWSLQRNWWGWYWPKGTSCIVGETSRPVSLQEDMCYIDVYISNNLCMLVTKVIGCFLQLVFLVLHVFLLEKLLFGRFFM